MKKSLIIVKIGGNVIDNEETCGVFLNNFATLPYSKILVHGGGKIATQTAARLNIDTQMIDGRRITDQAMLDVVTMVYGGLVNKQLVARLQSFGCNAIGLTGADAGAIHAHKRPIKDIDYGFVGDVDTINATLFSMFLENKLIPVVAPLSFDKTNATMLNTNADTMASAVAVALASSFDVNLVYCFEKKGVLSDPTDDDAVINHLQPKHYEYLKATGIINKGMIPKLDNAFAALRAGVNQVTICHADDLKKTIEVQNAGTKITL